MLGLAETIRVYRDPSITQVQFALGDLHQALARRGFQMASHSLDTLTTSQSEICIVLAVVDDSLSQTLMALRVI